MRTTGIFTKHKVTLKLPKGVPGGVGAHAGVPPVRFIPFGCVHYGCSNHAKKEFDEFCARERDAEDTYYLGMGDYFDMLSAKERKVFRSHEVHDQTRQTMEEHWEELVDEFVDRTAFMHGKLIGLIEGNHYGDLSAGITTTQRMVQKYIHKIAGVKNAITPKYLGVSSLIWLGLQRSGQGHPNDHCVVFAHHGRGAARTLGGSLNPVEKMADIADANIYLMGHDHRKMTTPDCKLHLILNTRTDEVIIQDRPIIFARTGSFLKGYVEDRVSYVVDANYRPLQLGVVEILMGLKKAEKGTDRYELWLKGTA